MKLEIELVPKSSWYRNLRSGLSRDEWNNIRKEVYKKAGHKCEICKLQGKLFCHELWNYDETRDMQKLMGFQALCEKCHYIKHLGLVNVKIASCELPNNFIDILTDHFCKVNNCSKEDFKAHEESSYKKWINMSKKNWTVELTAWKNRMHNKQKTLENFYEDK